MADSSKDIQLRELKDMINDLRKMIKTLQATVDAANKREETLTQERDNLKEEVALLRKKLFGASSEKRSLDIPGQLNFFNEAEMEQDPAAAKAEELEACLPEKTSKKRKARATDAERFKGVPIEKKYLDLFGEEKSCPVCGTPLKEIGEEFVRRELVFIPAKLKVYEYYSKNYECPKCKLQDLPVIKKGKELADDPEFQARVEAGLIEDFSKKVKEEKKVSKEAKISVTIFLIAMVGIVLLGAVSGLVPTLADGSKLPLTTVIEIFMLVAAAAMILLTKLDSNKVLDQPVFRTGMFAVVLAFGLCWLVNTFIGDQSSFITDNMSALTNKYPWIFIVAVFIVGAITTSQSSTTMIMIPIGIALGLPANVIVAGWIACSSNYFIPASGQCVAALAFDSAGTTKIGKFVLNHSYMIPGLVCTVVSVVVALLIGAVVF